MDNTGVRANGSMIFDLRALFDRYGYRRYKMSKFEEYDLYAHNKDFLISESVITFTDTNGKLMALKPDVTLSIVKNTRDGESPVQKLYYHESVYRVVKGSHSFREITQVGLEAIGRVDDYCIYEVLKLAGESLAATGRNCVLAVSHLGLISQVLEWAGVPESGKGEVLRCIGEKNLHELTEVCKRLGVSGEKAAHLGKTVSVCGGSAQALPRLRALLDGVASEDTLSRFVKIISALEESGTEIRVDFSLVNDTRYYNGFVFKGFAEGIPAGVLSGGQYDMLMKKMDRASGAIGFAVYVDLLEQYGTASSEYDADVLVVYDGETPIAAVDALATSLRAEGKSVCVQSGEMPVLRVGETVRLVKGVVAG